MLPSLVAVVDDEKDILELVILHLKKAGYRVKGFSNGNDFLRFISQEIPDLIILDLMLPDLDGLKLCTLLKREPKWNSIPLIMLTAKTEETDRIVGLEMGADDYVTKPFSPKELVARVKAVLRRKEGLYPDSASLVKVGTDLVIDREKYQVTVNDKKINLTLSEFRILDLLCSRKGRVYSREEILNYLWKNEKIVIDRTVDVHIRNLREKLGKASRYLVNIRGVGYKIEE